MTMRRFVRRLAIVFVFCRCSCGPCANHNHCGGAACNTKVES